MADADLRIRIGAQDRASSAIGRVKTAVAGLIGAYLGFRAVKGVANFFKESINLAQEQQKAVRLLETALKSQGVTSKAISKDLQDYAASLQGVTEYGDEAIIQTQRLLLQMGVTPAYVKDATRVTLDWAAALGKDLNSAALDIGKAFTGNLMMLQRYGVRIDAETVRTKGFGVVIEELDKKFGGTAETIGMTFQGQVKRLGNLINDAKEKIGGAVVNSEAWRKLMETITVKVKNLNAWLADNREKIEQWGAIAADVLTTLGKWAIEAAKGIATFLQAWRELWGGYEKAKAQEIEDRIKRQTEALARLQELRKAGLIDEEAYQERVRALREEQNRSYTTTLDLTSATNELAAAYADNLQPATETIKKTFDEWLGTLEEAPKLTKAQFDEIVAGLARVREVTTILREEIVDDEMGAQIGDELTRILPGIKTVEFETDKATLNFLKLFEEVRVATLQFTQQWASNVVDAIFEGKLAFDEFVRDFIVGIMKMIVKMLLLKAISAGFGMPGFMAQGAYIPKLQTGAYIHGGPPYTDRYPAFVGPGEAVLNRHATAAIGGENAVNALNRGETFNNRVSINVTLGPGSGRDQALEFAEFLQANFGRFFREAKRRRQI